MNKTFLTTAVVCVFATQIFGQGTISFNASVSSGDPIKFSADGTTSAPYTLAGVTPFGAFNVGFFAAPNGTALTLNSVGLPDFSKNGWLADATILQASTSNPQGAGAVFSPE